MSARAANAYRQVDLESAPKTQIVERLFDRFAQDLECARAAIAGRDIQGRANALDHALRIVVELKASLDSAAAPELCASLSSLYDFVIARIGESTSTNSAKPLDASAAIMTQLGAAFREAHAK